MNIEQKPQTKGSSGSEAEDNTATTSSGEVVRVNAIKTQEAPICFVMQPEYEDCPETIFPNVAPENKTVRSNTLTLDDIPYHKWHGTLQEL